MIAGRLVAGGWLPQDVADQITHPAMVEALTGALIGLGALVWYWASKARRALRSVF
jgi:hypothetical protein